MKIDSGGLDSYIEVTGITQVWINRTIHWKKINEDCWKKMAGGTGFDPSKNITKSAHQFNRMINKRLGKRGDAGDGWKESMYRAWISGNTLNIVKMEVVTYNLTCHKFK